MNGRGDEAGSKAFLPRGRPFQGAQPVAFLITGELCDDQLPQADLHMSRVMLQGKMNR